MDRKIVKMKFQRYWQSFIQTDALEHKKIAFVSGPRQVGKTTLAQAILSDRGGQYYSFDDVDFKKAWIKNPKLLVGSEQPLIVFDEIHKDRLWKTKLKGLYDLYKNRHQFLVTGSARLDYYRKNGDSLQGRYFPYRLHPLSLNEAEHLKPPPEKDWDCHSSQQITSLKDLLNLSGFPEPLWGQSLQRAKRWQRLYLERMIQEDVRDFENIKEIRALENLSILLPEKVGSPLSIESLREDILSSYDSVKRWLQILEAIYFCYRIRPYSANIKYSLKKEPKLYLYDWSLCDNEGARWENFIAGHLLKNAQAWTDAAYGVFELHYLKDKQKREVDFLMTKDKKPWLMVEVKSQNQHISPALEHFYKILKPKFCFQIVKEKRYEKNSLASPIQVISAERFLQTLN